jgi:NADP-dependent 3-hydroxy acid dehydrogenase YdfG
MKDKTVAITGATSGLGRATALQLAQKGASCAMQKMKIFIDKDSDEYNYLK